MGADARVPAGSGASSPRSRGRLRGLVRFSPIALAIAIPLTPLDRVQAVRLAIVLPVAVLALRAPKRHWAYVFRSPFGVFLGFAVLSLAWSEQPRETVFGVGNLAVETLAALAMVGLGGTLATRYLADLLKLLLVTSAAVAVLLPSVGRMSIRGAPWQGVFNHKNSLGTIAAFAAIVFVTSGRPAHRLRWLAVALLILMATDSKTALAAALLSISVIALARSVYLRRPGRRPAPSVVFYGLVVVVGVVSWQLSAVILRLLNRAPNLTGRTSVWGTIVDYASAHPFTGTGLGAQIYDGSPLSLLIAAGRSGTLGTTHNGYLVVYLGLGMVGVVIFALVLLRFVVTVERTRRQSADGISDRCALAIGLLTCYLAINLAEDRLLSRSGWFFLLFGMLQMLPARTVTGVRRAGVERRSMPSRR